MRAPKRRRPQLRLMADAAIAARLAPCAERARYVCSPEHKDVPFAGCEPRPRADASTCSRELRDQDLMTQWLREAIRRGAVGEFVEGEFPRYVWYKEGSVVYEGRLVNRELGEYKGYPLEKIEWPAGVERLYE